MKFISWNIDSLNAALDQKSDRAKLSYAVLEKITNLHPDAVAIQETKLNEKGLVSTKLDILKSLFPNYKMFWNYSVEPAKKGYAGTLFLTKYEPISVENPKIGAPDTMDFEGRIITLEYPEFYLSQVYTPNSGDGLKRLDDRVSWDEKYRDYLASLNNKKPVIFSGDFNVAHEEIDLKNDKTNHKSPGFTNEERSEFTKLLNSGFSDIYREMNPDTEQYTWWAQRSAQSKINNTGWRIDYYLISEILKSKVSNVGIIDSGSRQDHTPIFIDINLSIDKKFLVKNEENVETDISLF
jgi:exodeoxyribonuclease-3